MATTAIGSISGGDKPGSSVVHLGPYRKDQVPASQAAAFLTVGATDANTQTGIPIWADCQVLGVVIRLGAAITAGTATFTLNIGANVPLTLVLNAGATGSVQSVTGGTVTMIASNVFFVTLTTPYTITTTQSPTRFLACKVATDASYAPATLNWHAYPVVRFNGF